MHNFRKCQMFCLYQEDKQMQWCVDNIKSLMPVLPPPHLSILLSFWPPTLKYSQKCPSSSDHSKKPSWDTQTSHMSLHDKCHYRDEDLTHPGIQKEGFKRLSQTLDSFSTSLNFPGSSRFISAKPCVRLTALLSMKKTQHRYLWREIQYWWM